MQYHSTPIIIKLPVSVNALPQVGAKMVHMPSLLVSVLKVRMMRPLVKT